MCFEKRERNACIYCFFYCEELCKNCARNRELKTKYSTLIFLKVTNSRKLNQNVFHEKIEAF